MDYENSKRLLNIFIENSNRILSAGFGLNCVESTFFEVVELLKEYSDLKAEFMSKVEVAMAAVDVGILVSEIPSHELIELVAHEMRWMEILECAEMRIRSRFHGDRSLAVGDIATSVIEAYNDNWPDREFYAHYA